MAISDRTRSTLLIRAGGRCSLCQVLLVSEGTASDAPSVFGEVAHIVAQSPGGPRAGYIAEVDGYDNLILLCSIHHKQIDDQPEHFTVERLRSIKLDHEAWVRAPGEVSAEAVPLSAPAAPAAALTVALTIHVNEEVLFWIAVAIVLLLAAMVYQAYRSTHLA
jgi:hypothetical protein